MPYINPYTKIEKKSFRKWEKENEGQLVSDYEFNINECFRQNEFESDGDIQNIKKIGSYWNYAKNTYKLKKDDQKYEKKKKK